MPGYKGGYMGKILMVNLSTGTISEEGLPSDDILRSFIGCWGLSMKYLYDLLPPGYSATDPENPMIFMTAPLTGLHLPGATNITLGTKNFDTGFTVGRSHTHGSFGTFTRAAGYDGFIITGKSDKPVYLWIHNDNVQLRDASHLWGKTDTHETEDIIKNEVGNPKISVAAIGPCGENLCAGGMICNDKNHSFSHSGVGTVMGSKNLKAIAIYGDHPLPVADPDKLASVNKEWLRHIKLSGHFGWNVVRNQASKKAEYRYMLKSIGFAGKNFQINQLSDFAVGWSEQKFTPKPCPRCPIGCSYNLEITTGPYKGHIATLCGGGEALEGGGSILGITEPGSCFYLADLMDRLGIEGSVGGCTIAMAIEAYEKGLITRKDTDGLELRWGDSRLAETLLRKMAAREGFGEILSRGIKEAAETIGGDAPGFAVNIKGTGMSLHDWRPAWGVLLGQIVGSGAGWPAPGADFAAEPEAGYPDKSDPFDYRSKPLEVKKMGMLKFMNDCTGMCFFVTLTCQNVLQLTADALSAATGWDYTPEELLTVGERVMQLERAFNVRHGLKPEDDWTVPERLVEAPGDGPAKGMSIKPYLEGMVKEYHRLMGWDAKTGKPWRATLKRLGLDYVLPDLWGSERI